LIPELDPLADVCMVEPELDWAYNFRFCIKF
jgi:hypothetical protein